MKRATNKTTKKVAKKRSTIMSKGDFARAHRLIDEIGSEKERGYIFIAKIKEKTIDGFDVDAIAKGTRVSKKLALIGVTQSLEMDPSEALVALMIGG